MPRRHTKRPLGAFLKALREEKIECILIGAMAAVEQGAPLATRDYDLWVRLPERQYVRLLTIVHRQKGTFLAPTMYELRDGTMVNAVFKPDGLRSFQTEYRYCKIMRIAGEAIRVLPLKRVIASKRAANRDKDQMAMPALKQTLRCLRRLRAKKHGN